MFLDEKDRGQKNTERRGGRKRQTECGREKKKGKIDMSYLLITIRGSLFEENESSKSAFDITRFYPNVTPAVAKLRVAKHFHRK